MSEHTKYCPYNPACELLQVGEFRQTGSEDPTKYKFAVESDDLAEIQLFVNARKNYCIINEIKSAFYEKWKWAHSKDWEPYDMLIEILNDNNFEE